MKDDIIWKWFLSLIRLDMVLFQEESKHISWNEYREKIFGKEEDSE